MAPGCGQSGTKTPFHIPALSDLKEVNLTYQSFGLPICKMDIIGSIQTSSYWTQDLLYSVLSLIFIFPGALWDQG